MKPQFVSLKTNINKIEKDLSRHTKKGKCIKNQDRKRGLTSSLKEKIIRIYHWQPCSQDGSVEGCVLISPVRIPNLQLTNEQPSTGEYWIPPKEKKKSPCSRAKEKPQQDSKRSEIAFRLKLHTGQRCSEGSNQTLCTPGPKYPKETEPDLPLSVQVSPAEAQTISGLLWGQGLWLQKTWEAQGVNPTQSHRADNPQTGEQLYQRRSRTVAKFEGPQQISQPGDPAKGLRTHREFDFGGQWYFTIELPQDWGKTPQEGAHCVHQDPGERSSDPTRN